MDERIRQALDYIEDNVAISINLKHLAGTVYLSPYYFHRLFKKETGISARKFIELLKIEKAYQIIIEGKTQIQDLAMDLGYNDYETFSRAFKKHHNISPDNLRAIILKVKEQVGQAGAIGKLMVIRHDSFDQNIISEKIAKKLADENYELTDPSMVRTYIINNKTGDELNDILSTNIKNKYVMQPETKIWEKVLALLEKENTK